MFVPTRRCLPLAALLASFAAAPAPAGAAEVAALSLEPSRALNAYHVLTTAEYSVAFTAQASGRLTRVTVPAERRLAASGPGYSPLEVSLHEVGVDGRFTGPALASDALAPAEVPDRPASAPYESYTGGAAEAVFADGPALEKGRRYAVRLAHTGYYDYVLGAADHDDTRTWWRHLRGTSWSHYTDVALDVLVAPAAPPPPPVPVDTTAPTAAITSPADGAELPLGSPAFAAFACADEGGSLLAGCAGVLDGTPLAAGAPIDTSTVGPRTLTVDATDGAGNTQSAVSRFSVVWPFGGFYAPVNVAPTRNSVRAGSAVPIKFSLGGDRGLDVLDGAPVVRAIACGDAPVDELEETATGLGSGLTYDAGTGRYHYVWKTSSEWAGSCRQLTVRLKDGTAHSAVFSLR